MSDNPTADGHLAGGALRSRSADSAVLLSVRGKASSSHRIPVVDQLLSIAVRRRVYF